MIYCESFFQDIIHREHAYHNDPTRASGTLQMTALVAAIKTI